MAYAMASATHEDMKVSGATWTDADFLEALDKAPPGIIDRRSWAYWNLKMGRYPAPRPRSGSWVDTSTFHKRSLGAIPYPLSLGYHASMKPEMLRLTADPERPRVFRCPNCNETINTAMRRCAFCSSQIDGEAAEKAADLQAKVNEAYSQAMNLAESVRSANAVFPVLGGLVASLVGSLSWRLRFGALRSDDPDLALAKQAVGRGPIAMLLWSIGFFCFLALVGVVISILSGH